MGTTSSCRRVVTFEDGDVSLLYDVSSPNAPTSSLPQHLKLYARSFLKRAQDVLPISLTDTSIGVPSPVISTSTGVDDEEEELPPSPSSPPFSSPQHWILSSTTAQA